VTAALIGHTGFVGSYLATQATYDLRISRVNLDELRDRRLDRIVCVGLPAAKWIANRNPLDDRANMERLVDVLRTVRARRFLLISTIDVYPRTEGVDEGFDCSSQPNHAYGTHRLAFERFIGDSFPDATIVRLPALFGPGLRKNVLFDLLHGNQLELINPASRFQWYPLLDLPPHMELAERHGLKLVNLFTEPLRTELVLRRSFPGVDVGSRAQPPVAYDLHTRHAHLFNGVGRYIMPAAIVLERIAEFCGAETARLGAAASPASSGRAAASTTGDPVSSVLA
jgi:NAD dependent epimerase/dehydratase family